MAPLSAVSPRSPAWPWQQLTCCFLPRLTRSGLFDNVDARVTPSKKGKCNLTFVFSEKIWPPMTDFSVEGASILPGEVPPKVNPGGPT